MKTEQIKIEKSAYGGDGLGFIDGKACFVQYAVPDDFVEIEIHKEKKDFSFGRIINIIKQSELRVKPECPNFGKCGGCDYLNISYDNELKIKKGILKESLTRTGRIPSEKIPELSVIKSSRYHYRSHASVKSLNSESGFYAKESNHLVTFPEKGCMLLAEPLINKLSSLQNMPEEFKISLSGDSQCLISFEKEKTVRENEYGLLFDRNIMLFFQANKFLRESMLRRVSEYAELSKDSNFIDIGCGVGFFSLFLADKANTGHGVDISRESIKWARHNAELNKITNITFEAKPASEIHPYRSEYDVVIADPPRAGLSVKARKTINAISAQRIVYISCNPSTFSRDASDFISSGYSLNKLTLIDMFPGTYHIELIGLFTL
ncbi:MAG: class I SAM-dependent RNA methyltransferase [Spirochaetes bacterium]|nr:class I SAM-dependent RNA methyltransferase [Spirochaetota bacterium]